MLGAPGETALARFVAARDAGDAAGAGAAWEELLTLNVDRVRAMVALWGRGGRLSADEREDAVQRALVRVWRNMAGTFAGSSPGEWVNAVRTCVGYACLDVQREAAGRSGREAPLEEGDVVAHVSHARAEERADAVDFLAWALPLVDDERRRLVLTRTLDGAPAAAIAAELGVEMGNLYQLRSRGLKDLARLREQWEA